MTLLAVKDHRLTEVRRQIAAKVAEQAGATVFLIRKAELLKSNTTN